MRFIYTGLAVMTLAFLQPLVAAPLIGITLTGQVLNIDQVTGAGTLIGNTGLSSTFGSLVTDASGNLYTVDFTGGVFRLDTVNSNTGAATVGPTLTGLINSPTFLSGLAFSSSGTLFASIQEAAGTRLYTINTSSGASSPIGLILGSAVTDLAFASNGTLYGWDIAANTGLLTVNTVTGAGAVVNPTVSPLTIFGLTFRQDGTLFAAQFGTPDNLGTVNTGTGVPALVGPIGSFDIRGIAFVAPEPSSFLLTLSGLLPFLLPVAVRWRARRRQPGN